MRKVFLDDLPHRKSQVDWVNCVNKSVDFIYDNVKGKLKIVAYANQALEVSYNDNPVYKIACGTFRRGQIGSLLGHTTVSNYLFNINEIILDDNRHMIITNREYRKDKNNSNVRWYKYNCKKCGWEEGWIQEYMLTRGVGCSCCAGKTIVEGINDIPTTDPWMIPYFQGGYDEARLYAKASNKTIVPVCPDCGRIKEKHLKIQTIFTRRSIGCVCSDGISFPNRFMYSILSHLNENFESEVRFEWCKYLDYQDKTKIKRGIYDFVLYDKKVIIEMDGGLGHGHNSKYISTDESKYIDQQKDAIAQRNGYKIFRVDCYCSDFDSIKKALLKSQLRYYLNFESVNWDFCDEMASTNLLKRVCEMYNSIEDFKAVNYIVDELHLGYTTVRSYLHKGTKLGFCTYDTKSILKKIGSSNISIVDNRKKVICLNTEEVFDSVKEAESKYNISGICGCCKGKNGFCGKNKDGELLQWQYYSEYLINKKKLMPKIELRKSKRRKKVICIETGEIFNSLTIAAKEKNIHIKSIGFCCNKKQKMAGEYHWMYYDDYLINGYREVMCVHHLSKKVICINNGLIYESISKVEELLNIDHSNVSACCKGKVKTAGKSLDGTSLKWMYYEDYFKLHSKELQIG